MALSVRHKAPESATSLIYAVLPETHFVTGCVFTVKLQSRDPSGAVFHADETHPRRPSISYKFRSILVAAEAQTGTFTNSVAEQLEDFVKARLPSMAPLQGLAIPRR